MSSLTELGNFIRKVKAECREAFMKANKEDKLYDYLVSELRRNNISFDAAVLKKYIDKSLSEEEDFSPPANASSIIDEISNQLDTNIYHPLLENSINPMEAAVLSKIDFTDYYRHMHANLRITKVVCAFFGVCALGTAIGKGIRGNGGLLLIYAALAADLFRVSYNACTKHYILLEIRKLSSIENIKKSIFDWASSTLGISNKESDLFAKLNSEVRSEILLTNTITQKAVQIAYEVHRN